MDRKIGRKEILLLLKCGPETGYLVDEGFLVGKLPMLGNSRHYYKRALLSQELAQYKNFLLNSYL